MATSPASMTPAAALARHLEWLEYALAAARDEEERRRDRLANATKKNRDKRTVRLAEVTSEVTELAALVEGIKSLQKQAARPSTSASPRKPAASARTSKPATRKTATRKPATTKPAAKPAGTAPASASAASTNGMKPKAATRKPATRKPATKTTRRSSTTRRSGTSS